MLPFITHFAGRFCLLWCCLLQFNTLFAQQAVETNCPDFSSMVVAHFNKQLSLGTDVYGPEQTAFWMSSLDTYSGRYPKDDNRPPHIPQRAYLDRFVDAPKGSTLYWDMPSVTAAFALTETSGTEWYRQKAEDYVRAFLDRCIAENGIFLWGNHYYYDAYRDSTMKFGSQPVPVDFSSEVGNLHEIRPIMPAWDIFWKIDPEATEKEIRLSTLAHMVDTLSGEFNRHADGLHQHAFLEAGASLVYGLAWLYAKTADQHLLEQADRIVQYSYTNRNLQTGLLENNPTSTRWDKVTATSEVGLWTALLLKAAEFADDTYRTKWEGIAEQALSNYLGFAYDPAAANYYGMLNIADGKPIFREAGDNYPYKPTDYSDLWIPLFPTHNYPFSLAESCLMLYRRTGKAFYLQHVQQWAALIRESLPARHGQGAYAEHYGRAIFFLLNCADQLDDPEYKALAEKVGREASDVLFAHGMFRSHPGEYRYDAVDGVGILSLALLWLESGQKPDLQGLYF